MVTDPPTSPGNLAVFPDLGPSCQSTQPTLSCMSVKDHFPPPEDLAAYEAAVPGAGDRILSMAERRLELAGRDRELHHTEFMKIVGTNAATERLGQVVAGMFIISIMVVWGIIMLSEIEERLKIASTVFPAVIAGANAYRAIRNMWRRERSPADRSRDDSPPELEKAPGWERSARD